MKRWLLELLSRLDSWHVLLPIVAAVVIVLLIVALAVATRTRPVHLTWR